MIAPCPEYNKIPQQESNLIFNLVRELRPKQWTKNSIVLAALLFSFKVATMAMLVRSVIGFFLFCFVSGSVYIINDFADRQTDRLHPEKCYRPIASGALDPYLALVFGGSLLVVSLGVAWHLEPLFALILIIYFCSNIVYSFYSKHVVILDVMTIATGFVLRAIGGALVIDVMFTPWFLFCTMLLALFLAISKRRHEIYLLQNSSGSHRRVLDSYSPELLNQMNSIVTAGTIMSYSLFTFTSGHTLQLMWTIPLVIYGVFRYIYLIHHQGKGGQPEKVLMEDGHILGTVILYGLMVLVILNYFE